jgi:hypothetical protein
MYNRSLIAIVTMNPPINEYTLIKICNKKEDGYINYPSLIIILYMHVLKCHIIPYKHL